MWQTISPRVVDDIYVAAAQNNNPGKFNTIVDIKLKHWAEKSLANTSIQVSLSLLQANVALVMCRTLCNNALNSAHEQLDV
jgi:optic atrophy protein 1